jgi:hypothetical protein
VADSCEDDNGAADSTEGGEFLDQRSDYQLLKKGTQY